MRPWIDRPASETRRVKCCGEQAAPNGAIRERRWRNARHGDRGPTPPAAMHSSHGNPPHPVRLSSTAVAKSGTAEPKAPAPERPCTVASRIPHRWSGHGEPTDGAGTGSAAQPPATVKISLLRTVLKGTRFSHSRTPISPKTDRNTNPTGNPSPPEYGAIGPILSVSRVINRFT